MTLDYFERTYPTNLQSNILYPLLGGVTKCEITTKDYEQAIEKFENDCNSYMINLFSKIDIQATTKTVPYSLPYKKEIIVKQNGESYLNGPYELSRVARNILKELLISDINKIRFYLYVEVRTDIEIPFMLGEVVYHFRYYEH